MVAIHTKYLGPTNSRGSRYKAYSTKDRKTVTVGAQDALSSEENHHAAARAYCKLYDWHGVLAHGGTDTGNVYVFIQRKFNITKINEMHDCAETITV